MYLFYFWMHWVFIAVCRLSLVPVSWDCSSLLCMDFSLQWLLLFWGTVSRHRAFTSCK